MSVHLKTVNFGSSKTGLSTVGYTLYDESGSVLSARSTSGVFEVGSTGIYGAKVSFPKDAMCILLWDTGEATPRYAQDESTIQLNAIQDETDRIRVIWNTLQNVGDSYAKLLQKIDGIRVIDNKNDFEDLAKEIKKIVIPKIPTIDEMRSALTVNVNPPKVPAPVVNIPKTVIPDYTKKLAELSTAVESLASKINLATSDTKKDMIRVISDNGNNVKGIIEKLSTIGQDILSKIDESGRPVAKAEEVKSVMGSLFSEVGKLQKSLVSLEEKLSGINANISDTMKPGKFLQDIYQMLKQSEDLRNLAEDYQKRLNSLRSAGIG